MVRNTTRVHLLKALLIASTAIIPVASVSVAQAQTAARPQPASYDIPAQSLSDSLAAFARATGLRIVYPAELAQGKSAPAVQGALTQNEALERLLSGSGLAWRLTGGNAVTIYKSSSAAGAAPVDADGSLVLDTITVAGGSRGFSADTPYETAGSSTYISGEKIERFRGTSVGDMLSGTPGVLNGDNRLGGGALDVNIRGMQGQGRVPVSVDGAIQETTVWRGYTGVAGRSYVDPDFIGGVMIEKGPSSAADGAGVIGGIVRMNTITVDDILLPEKSFGIRVKGGFNSNSSSVPPIDTLGGLAGDGTYPNSSVPTSFGGPNGMDRPAFLEPTGGNGSIAAGYRSEYVDLVAAYARRKNGNYHAGTRGDVPEPKFYTDCAAVSNDSCFRPQPGQTTVEIEGLNHYRAGEEVLNTSQDNESILLKGTIRLPNDQEIDLSYMRYESEYGEIMPSQILWQGGSYQAILNSVTMNTYTAKYKWDPADNELVDLKAGLWMTDADLRIPYQWYGWGNDPSLTNYYGTKNRRWGINASNTSRFETALGGLSLSYGGSYTYETIQPGNGADLGNGRSGNRREVSLFTSGEWKPADWLTLNASLRYSDFTSNDTQLQSRQVSYRTISDGNGGTIEITDEEWRAYPVPRPTTISRRTVTLWEHDDKRFNGDGVAPMVSATVEPWDGIQLYGKYSEAIRLPSLFETTRGFSTNYFGTDLSPEHAKTWEFGINILRDDVLSVGDKLRIKASYFDNTVDGYITRTSLANIGAPIVNLDYAKLRGFELSGSYDLGKFFGDLAYTRYLHTEFCAIPGRVNEAVNLCGAGGTENSYIVNQIPPRDSLSLTLGTRVFDEKLTVGGRVTYNGKRPASSVVAGSGGGTIEHIDWKPYTIVDLFASYKINENFQIDAAIDNLTDVYYMDALTLGMMPSPGRTFRLNMTAKF